MVWQQMTMGGARRHGGHFGVATDVPAPQAREGAEKEVGLLRQAVGQLTVEKQRLEQAKAALETARPLAAADRTGLTCRRTPRGQWGDHCGGGAGLAWPGNDF